MVDTPEAHRLDPAVVRAWRISGFLWLIGMLGGLAVAGRVLREGEYAWWGAAVLAAVGGIVLIATLLVGWLPPARFRHWSYELAPGELVLRYGVVWRTVSVVPYARIQHVDTRQGPLERHLGLTRLIIYTAGVQGAVLGIPGLASRDAEALRERLLALAGGDDAV